MPQSASRAAILVVEDDRVFGETLCRVLGQEGYGVTLATHFRAALDVIEAPQPVDLMLLDIVMPDGVNGIALSRMARLRRHDLKVLYLTGYDIPGAEQEALGPILRKPIETDALILEVGRVLAS